MAKRWVIKLGSGLLTRKDGKVDRVQIGRIVDQVAGLHKRGIQVVLVTSGAVGRRHDRHGPREAPEGSPRTPGLRHRRPARADVRIRQAPPPPQAPRLADAADLLGPRQPRTWTRNARATLDLLLARKRFVPIVNENDAIADEEIKVGDNDRLSAHVAAALVGAEASSSSSPGIQAPDDEVRTAPATFIPSVRRIDDSARALAGGAGSRTQHRRHAPRSCSPRRSRPKAASTRSSPAADARKSLLGRSPTARTGDALLAEEEMRATSSSA
jgi:glutamate 5-kinase